MQAVWHVKYPHIGRPKREESGEFEGALVCWEDSYEQTVSVGLILP